MSTTQETGWQRVWGHEQIVAGIQHALAQHRLSQAVLLSGPASVGKTLIAELIAQALLCPRDPTPCGACQRCLAVTRRTDADCLWLAPSSPTTAVPIEALREVLRQLHQTPVGGARHVAVLVTIEQLTPEAATVLLKTLEEPPPAAQFVLTTHDLGRCLPTIVSRCQVLRCAPMGRDALATLLTARRQLPAALARRAAVVSGGCIGTALQFAEQPAPHAAAPLAALGRRAEWSADRRDELFGQLEAYLWWCRDALCCAAQCDDIASAAPSPIGDRPVPSTVEESSDVLDEALVCLEALEDRVNPKLIQWVLQQRWQPAAGSRQPAV